MWLKNSKIHELLYTDVVKSGTIQYTVLDSPLYSDQMTYKHLNIYDKTTTILTIHFC